jgi:hypothetical protein
MAALPRRGRIFLEARDPCDHVVFHTLRRTQVIRYRVIAQSTSEPHGNRMWGCCQILIHVAINFRQPPEGGSAPTAEID